MSLRTVIAAGVSGVVIGAVLGLAIGVSQDADGASGGENGPLLPDVGRGASFEIRPVALEMDLPGEVAFSFDLVATTIDSLSPAPDNVYLDDVPVVVPLGWTLLTDRGELVGDTVNPSARRALFSVPENLVLEEIRGVRLDGYRLAVPYEESVVVPFGSPVTDVVPGVDLIALVSDADSEWLVEFVLDSDDAVAAGSLAVVGLPEIGGIQIGGSDTDGWRAWYAKKLYPAVPDPLPVVVGGLRWVEIADQISMSVGGL